MSQSSKHQRYSKKIKLEAIRRVLEDGEPVQIVVEDLGIRHRDNVYQWINKYKESGEHAFDLKIGRPTGKSTSVDKEIRDLKVEVAVLKKYLEILRLKR